MKCPPFPFIILFLFFGIQFGRDASAQSKNGFLVTLKGKSVSSIVLAKDATGADQQAATELQKYIRRISGATLQIAASARARGARAIRIGSAGHADGFPATVDWENLDDDGFSITTSGHSLFIAGGRRRGTLYAVYTLLESYLGCRKYSPTVEVIPRRPTIDLPTINTTQVPRLKFRDAFSYDPGYMAWHKLDNHDSLFGLYVHTFDRLVPPEKYFSDHPEYFSILNRKRRDDAQLCLTNADLGPIVINKLREYMAGDSAKQYWSVSQNDTFGPCECDSCRLVDSIEGSHAGSLLRFINRIAAEFPNKTISTLAYQYSRSAPKLVRPAPNVNIMFCSIECNRSRPLATDTASASFRNDMRDWTSLTKNIYMWDYVVQFRNLISPFPNLRVLQPNIQYFIRNGITALFEQGSGTLPNEFKELRTYLIAKLMWDPDINVDSVMDDFLSGFYGNAAPFIRSYIDTMHTALELAHEDLGIYGFPMPSQNGYLSPAHMDLYGNLFDKAEASVSTDTILLDRVRIARLPLQFALLEQAKLYGTGPRGFFEQGSDSLWRARADMEQLLQVFLDRCRRYHISALNEMGTTPENYETWTRQFLQNSMKHNLALFKPVVLKDTASPKYHNGDPAALTDGLRGLDDYHLNWLGFHGVDMEATVDLGSIQKIRRMRTDFFQYIDAWIFLPTNVEYLTSTDGVRFVPAVTVQRAIPQNRKGIWSVAYPAEIEPVEARFVRVKATSLKQCPDWHKRAGSMCWIFADEIVVE